MSGLFNKVKPMMDLRLLTAPELAAVLRVNVKDLYRKALTGEIPSYKFGKSRRFKLDEVLAASRNVPPPAVSLVRVLSRKAVAR